MTNFLEREPLEIMTKENNLLHINMVLAMWIIKDKENLEKFLKNPYENNILVSGTGFIGYHLANKLKK